MLSPSSDASNEGNNYELITVNQFANEAGCKGQATTSIAIDNWSKDCSLSGDTETEDAEPRKGDPSTAGDGFPEKCQGKSGQQKGKSLHSDGSVEGKESTTNRPKNDHECGKSSSEDQSKTSELLYSIDEVPPWYIAIGLGFQQYMLMFSSVMVVPFILSGALCFSDKPVVISNVLNTILFVSGIVTFLQATFGSRLPIIQGTSFAFVAPALSSMALKGPCRSNIPLATANASQNLSASAPMLLDEEWRPRMLEIQGAIVIASFIQMVFGLTGVVGRLLKFVGPLTIVPTIVLVGLPLFETAYNYSSAHWGIAMFKFLPKNLMSANNNANVVACLRLALKGINYSALISVTTFSQLLREVKTPFPHYNGEHWRVSWLPLFKLFPVMLSIIISWILCAILTYSGVFSPGHKARTDQRISVLQQVPWIRVPYPGQWGVPTINLSTIIGMVAAVLTSMLESIGDYYACAKISGAPPPPKHAINRGLGMEGFGCLLTGLWGTGCGTTSFSDNIAALGITRVGSRRVIQFGALFMCLVGIIGKFGALFITIPDPVIGGNFIALFGLLIGVGMSPLQFIDLNSMRNLFVLGNALFFGMVLPFWVKWTPNAIETGSIQLDQVITVLLSTPMAIGGMTGFLLDNLLPGTLEERGLKRWRMKTASVDAHSNFTVHTYDIPFITPYLQKFKIVKYLPFLPYYGEAYFEKQHQESALKSMQFSAGSSVAI